LLWSQGPHGVVAGNPATLHRLRLPAPLIAAFLELRWWRYAPNNCRASTHQPSPAVEHCDFASPICRHTSPARFARTADG
jgi:hypothetical protein